MKCRKPASLFFLFLLTKSLYDANFCVSSFVAVSLRLARYSRPHCTTYLEGALVQVIHGTDRTCNYRVTYDPRVEELVRGNLFGLLLEQQ